MDDGKGMQQNLQEQILELKKKLNAINEEKERWFAKRGQFSKEFKDEIAKVKESIKSRDQLSASVQEQKRKRSDLNKALLEKFQVAKTLKEEQKVLEKKQERKIPIGALKQRMVFLEKRIETEALPFEKEKELMKQIKDLKKQYDEGQKEEESWQKIRTLSQEIKELKKQADTVHKGVQEIAGASQEKHETLVVTSRKIDDLKKQEREAHEKFIELKKQFGEVNVQLKALLPELKIQQKSKSTEQKNRWQQTEEQKQKAVELRAQKVEEKIKQGGKRVKLTMEDLLAFQGVKEKEEKK